MSSPILTSKTIGGNGGSAWDDNILSHKPSITGVHKIDIRAGDQVDSIQVTYFRADGSLYTAPKHGGSGGSLSTVNLTSDEQLVRVEGKTNNVLIDQLTFTSKNSSGTEKKHGPYGRTGETPFVMEGNILGFSGRAGGLLDGLAVFYRSQSRSIQTSQLFGGSGGSAWDDNIIYYKPMIIGIYKIEIRAGNQVDSIQVTYFCEDGSLLAAPRHGGSGGSLSTITLASDERIVKVSGRTNNDLIDQLTFISKKWDGTVRQYGPYGRTGDTPFAIEGNVMGFKGRAGGLLDGLGVYYSVSD